jgi:hypothetical protein
MMPHSPVSRSRRKPPTPLSSFDPRFRELLLQGAKEVVEIPCASRSEAVRLRQRLNQYRFAAKQYFGEADHSAWEPLYRCIVQQKDTVLLLRPRDSEFDKALGLAGALPKAAAVLPDDFLTKIVAENGEAEK